MPGKRAMVLLLAALLLPISSAFAQSHTDEPQKPVTPPDMSTNGSSSGSSLPAAEPSDLPRESAAPPGSPDKNGPSAPQQIDQDICKTYPNLDQCPKGKTP
jgi:hypothetical protein